MKNIDERLGADYERAVASLTNAAWDQELLDVAYGFVDSPFGPLLVAMTKCGVVRVEYPNGGLDEQLEGLSAEVSPRLLESPRHTEALRRELDEYFEGKRQMFSVPPDLTFLRGFGRRVLEETAGIPFGALATYREVATRAGSPRASRAAGNALAANPVPIVVPCHRVVHSGGGLGGYTGGLDRKITLLQLEGVDVPPYRPPTTKRAIPPA
ncbi:MAG: methylated-DNA--[protein]-cysteine S-methyltransferase [Actinomycetota bacterium]|nr:methylated-DNA--[protein]-cysteine S-methyltransferase [Actinomycetota bacterium]